MSTISKSGQNADASYEIRPDTNANTLYLEFSGTLTADEMQTAADETIDAAESLEDGFRIINDISEFTPPSPEAAKPIQEAQVRLKEMGVADVVRVVAEETSAVTENAFQRRSRQAGYEGKTATTVDEAERKLD
ncbi:hypothetical protein [Haloarcula salinisoli]|uniref:Uncharacterized protein n=1 Tax=Haloarcula salinisoli TaxID=2487746 RepID=A0A8J7YH90_9EURY|nr:hypothetical protein [Halomicroarcula salinisoli]MBX0288294.1 hypothetical protein [Halomicroarcula salinisoli]MBX0305955.1 hypothetical protein [Halomicroarcula salinisoli]